MSPPSPPSTPAPTSDREDWSKARPAAIPRPTYAPAAMAFGLTLFFWGLLTSPVLLGAGLVVAVTSLASWIGEMRHEA